MQLIPAAARATTRVRAVRRDLIKWDQINVKLNVELDVIQHVN